MHTIGIFRQVPVMYALKPSATPLYNMLLHVILLFVTFLNAFQAPAVSKSKKEFQNSYSLPNVLDT